MSGFVKRLFECLVSVKDAVLAIAPGLKNFWPEVTAEGARMGTQGGMELASALFNGDAFVPYGPGQYTPEAQHEHAAEPQHEQGHEHDMSIER